MKIIETKDNDVNFVLHQTFNNKLFLPIGKYVNWKLENNWDDYNELYHAVNYIENLKQINGVWFDIHTIEKNQELKGVLTIVGGDIDKLETDSYLDKKTTILLKYFHIIEKGKGYGGYWLNAIIKPYYFDKGYRSIYVSSSHPKSFNFYNKIGTEVKTYTKKSDNQLYNRICKAFLIPMNQ
ncbi:hypothetical protein [Flavivirga eckloniae]|uniref:N-acetyltransferase domain-containing protein n=1 Tax=Flavivirga eckloniae TaxID=1803846 RepID=A0A2K9PP22_9FLAO|nr:hypothetical protein [Flavivirga eckloniae]AUP78794.1 hypothetical protein C1H87_08815 [Flavivirga eckloniae]